MPNIRAWGVIHQNNYNLKLFKVIKVNSNDLTTDKYAMMHNTSVGGVEDMASLGDLHEGSILNNLKIRYFKNEIYVSEILIFVMSSYMVF